MVIAGKIRGNAPQLASYLLQTGANERITIMDVDGQNNADAAALKNMLYSMELNSELTRSRNSVYHAYINPNPEDTADRVMTMEEWQQSVDLLTKQLGYEDQRKVVVLHEKPGARVHAHIVYERYNHERGTMATYEHNYKAHDRARQQMETGLNHKPTPQKNKNHDRHKETLTTIWQRTDTAEAFISEANANGYKIAKGTDRPFKVIDNEGVSFDLVRKLDGVKTNEVRQRFGNTELVPEKQAIREMQSAKQERRHTKQEHKGELPKPNHAQETVNNDPVQCKPNGTAAPTPATETVREQERQQFLQNVKDVRTRNRSITCDFTISVLFALRVAFSFRGSNDAAPERIAIKQQFTANAFAMTQPMVQKPPDTRLGFIEAAQYYKPT